MKLRPGQVVIFTAGDYSDYRIVGAARVLQAFDTAERHATFHSERRTVLGDVRSCFVARLIKDGLVEPVGADDVVEVREDDFDEPLIGRRDRNLTAPEPNPIAPAS